MPTQTYSEFKHSLKAIQISKLELFQFSAISSDKLMVWLSSGGVGEYTVHMSLIIKEQEEEIGRGKTKYQEVEEEGRGPRVPRS